jgi:hypothetical protein
MTFSVFPHPDWRGDEEEG